MTCELNGKTAIVTGASRGIGRAIAIKLGAMKASVAVNYVNDQKSAALTVADIEKASGKAVAMQADMRQVGDIQSLFDRTIADFGGVDILVNNAGILFCAPSHHREAGASIFESQIPSRKRPRHLPIFLF